MPVCFFGNPMKHSFVSVVAAGFAAACAGQAQARIIRTVEYTFATQPAGVIRVETEGGTIRVAPSADGQVRITAREIIRADTDAGADAILQNLKLSAEQHGTEVDATARYGAPTLGFHFGSWPPVEVDFIVAVPAGFSADLKTSGGNVAVGDLGGSVQARTSGGDIELGRLQGNVDASTSGGNVVLREGDGHVNLHTSGGQIKVGRAVGPAELSTSGGNVEVDAVENAIHASTSGGNMKAGIVGGLRGDCEFKTSGGTVSVTVDRDTAFRLEASTSGGNVSAGGLALTVERGGIGKSRLEGSVNGGGPLLKLHSSGGNVDISTR
jgi:hypothetical protein